MSHARKFLLLSGLVLCLLIAAGCGGSAKQKGPKIKGTIVLPPDIKLGESDSATLNFIQEGENAPNLSATINPTDLSFVVLGSPKTGVVPGTYKITVILQPYTPGESPERRKFDAINDRYAEGNSQLSYTVTEEPEQSIAIDLSKGTVTKK